LTYHAGMKAFLLFVVLACAALAAAAQEQAFTNRSTEMKDAASPDAKTIATLPENTSVKVLARQGGWTRVDASGKQGFLRVFHLRFPAVVAASSSNSGGLLAGVSAALGGRGDTKANLATTGVRGLSPEDLKNASPDAQALAKAHTYRADKPAAERFAREGKLNAVSVDYEGRK
jgi:Bacterial SH3 domain.